jgi:hypothetical protein
MEQRVSPLGIEAITSRIRTLRISAKLNNTETCQADNVKQITTFLTSVLEVDVSNVLRKD